MYERCVQLTRLFYRPIERPDLELRSQLNTAHHLIQDLVRVPLKSQQEDALTCLISDIVANLIVSSNGSLERSFLLTALNKGMMQIAAAQFQQFCCRNGKLDTRSWQKRKAEQELFLRGKLPFCN